MTLKNLNIDKSWTLFLDRDGVINKKLDNDYVKHWVEFEFLQGVFEALKKFDTMFGKIVVVTNQQGIGKHVYRVEDLELIHKNMLYEITYLNGRIDKVYFSPHLHAENHPTRKPNIGMALQAQKDFPEIDFNKSIIAGDSLSDMEFGRNAGMKTIFISEEKKQDERIDMQFSSLIELANIYNLKVSIITITYNSASTIEQTLLSVIEQNYTNIEYIIIDGGSTDGTLEIIEKYKNKISKFISEKDNGLYDALNKGISLATGDVIGILHSDDFYIDKTIIEKYINTFIKNHSDAVYSDLFYVDKENTNKIIRKWKSGNHKPNSFLHGWMPPHPTFFVKREVYQTFGNFNLEFKHSADYELMLRLIHKHKIKINYLHEFTIKMRVGGQSNVSVQNRINANIEDRKAWKINGLKPKFYTTYLKPLRKVLQFF